MTKKKYSCLQCDFYTYTKKDFNRHLMTKKHNKSNDDIDEYHNENLIYEDEDSYNENKLSDDENKKIKCDLCEKTFGTRQGLWYHKKKCNLENENDVTQLTKLVSTLVEQNTTLVKIISDTNSSTNINTQNNIQQQNNSFNLNFFLNETCKDAMNIDEFIDSIEVTVQDLKYLAKKGYVEGFSNLFIKHLEELDVSKRPLHCSDIKREIIHIRDKNNWEKDNDQKLRLTGIATDISRLNTIALQGKYQEQYPHCLRDSKSKEHNEYGKIAYEAFGGKLDLDTANKKFFRNLFKVVAIDKAIYK
jgi:hypothetical protein|uniref:C2H2-type domain-containing protein n=1 Tax=viral metagenome TaxID=1070528 RepID=A0A6C0IKH5_9ZZZZ